MIVDIKKAKANLLRIIQDLIDHKEDIVFVTENDKLVVKMTRVSNRVGVAKKEMDGFDISSEDFNSIPIENF